MALSTSYDFTLTRDDYIKAAYRELKVIDQDNDPTTNQITNAAEKLNILIKSWEAHQIFLWKTEWETFTLTASDIVVGSDGNDYECIRRHIATAGTTPVTGADYTTYWKATGGTGVGVAHVVTATYNSIVQQQLAAEIIGIDDGAFIRRDYIDVEITRMSEEEYMHTSNKTTVGKPNSIFYKRKTFDVQPEIILYPYPENTTDVIHLPVVKKLLDFDDATDNGDFTAAWHNAIVLGLADALALSFSLSKAERDDLKEDALVAFAIASGGDVENVTLRISPDFG